MLLGLNNLHAPNKKQRALPFPVSALFPHIPLLKHGENRNVLLFSCVFWD